MSEEAIRTLLEQLHARAVKMLKLRREWATCQAELSRLNGQVAVWMEQGLPLPNELRPLAAAALEAGELAYDHEANGSNVGPDF